MTRTGIIIAGGDVKETIEIPEHTLVVCADCGYRHALAQGIVPDAIVGDFDSWTESLPEGTEILRHPPEKDDTDTWLAIEYAKSHGCGDFVIYGAFGGDRIDHAIANIQLLHRMETNALTGTLVYGDQRVSLLSGGEYVVEILHENCGMFSLFSLTEQCTGVTVRNAKYPLEDAVLRQDYPLGVSNETLGNKVYITIETGVLLIVQTLVQSQNS